VRLNISNISEYHEPEGFNTVPSELWLIYDLFCK